MITGSQALLPAVRRLRDAGIEGAAGDARRLMAWAMGIGSDRLTLVLPETLSKEAQARFEAAVQRRLAREPVSHIIGFRAFYGRNFIVGPDVLDPRPETETLVEHALSAPFTRLLDLGCGSGAIVLTLLAECPDSTGVGCDLSDAARQMAQQNATALAVAERVDLIASDWFSEVTDQFDLIVSNPPYISAAEMQHLSPEVLRHEPHIALSPGGDGLEAYRQICAQSGPYLAPGGRLLFEIGPTQAKAVAGLMTAAGLSDILVLPDLDGRDRVLSGIKP
ncbi:peptide chain release factor N(5)-glutamine methyltransferase [Candidatus Halocynthiibacter alkanivorans]|uniref:peptide chain release factor N(5)-glutamine methyltransferase n=1 Tax=Candidatus Halocynthiibacter alkanivorans TaxID=2267619 RepID=UPI000DF2E327